MERTTGAGCWKAAPRLLPCEPPRGPHCGWLMGLPIVAWKFDVELPQPDGGALSRVCYVKLADRDLAVEALMREYPNAKFRILRGKSVSEETLDGAFPGDNFLADDVVRCV